MCTAPCGQEFSAFTCSQCMVRTGWLSSHLSARRCASLLGPRSSVNSFFVRTNPYIQAFLSQSSPWHDHPRAPTSVVSLFLAAGINSSGRLLIRGCPHPPPFSSSSSFSPSTCKSEGCPSTPIRASGDTMYKRSDRVASACAGAGGLEQSRGRWTPASTEDHRDPLAR